MAMNSVDLLVEIRSGRLTESDAEEHFNVTLAVAGRPGSEVPVLELFGFTAQEYSAYLHGATLTDLVHLRFNGWPERCARCGLLLDYEAGFWC